MFNYHLYPTKILYQPNIYRSDSKAELPDPVMLGSQQNSLHTPVTDIPFTLSEIQEIIDSYQTNKTWNDRQIYSIDSNSLDNNQLSEKDISYWNNAIAKSQELSMNMTAEQKQMMAEINDMFPPSKFEDE